MNIIICDDDIIFLHKFSSMLQKYLLQQNISFQLHSFSNAQKCLRFFLKNKRKIDIVFLDIYFDDELGTDVALQMRKANDSFDLIFLTISNEFAYESFRAQASYYLLKPPTLEKIAEALSTCKAFKQKDFITFKHNNAYVMLYLQNIIAVEVRDKYCYIHTTDSGIVKDYASLSNWKNKLTAPEFLQVNRSFIINMKHVAKIEHAFFRMKNDLCVPIKVLDRKSIREKYMQWLLNEG